MHLCQAHIHAYSLNIQGIHVAHVVIDGAIDGPWIRENFDALVKKGVQKKTSANDTSSEGLDMCHLLSTASIAESYFHLHMQQPCAWTFELDLRPQRERW